MEEKERAQAWIEKKYLDLLREKVKRGEWGSLSAAIRGCVLNYLIREEEIEPEAVP